MTAGELLSEFFEAEHRFWFVESSQIVAHSASTLTLRFGINRHLFVEIFLSLRSQRLSLALIGPTGRLYGRDGVKGKWHLHPFDDPARHELTPEGVSPQPLLQFMREVEDILLDNKLI